MMRNALAGRHFSVWCTEGKGEGAATEKSGIAGNSATVYIRDTFRER